MVRNYSISCPPGRGYYRVSMRREDGDGNNKPRGIISNYFLTKLDVGDTVMVVTTADDGLFTADL